MTEKSALWVDTEGWGLFSLKKGLLQPSHTYKQLSKNLEPLSSQEAYIETRQVQKLFSMWRHSSSGSGCPERLCSLNPWRFMRPQYIKPRATWSDLIAGPALRVWVWQELAGAQGRTQKPGLFSPPRSRADRAGGRGAGRATPALGTSLGMGMGWAELGCQLTGRGTDQWPVFNHRHGDNTAGGS